jgi:hypothetical protein
LHSTGGATLQLLYSLRLLNAMTAQTDRLGWAWSRLFVACGGRRHLLRLVAALDVDAYLRTPLFTRCLEALLLASTFFLGMGDGTALDAAAAAAAVEAEAKIDASAVAGVVRVLFEILRRVPRSSAAAAAEEEEEERCSWSTLVALAMRLVVVSTRALGCATVVDQLDGASSLRFSFRASSLRFSCFSKCSFFSLVHSFSFAAGGDFEACVLGALLDARDATVRRAVCDGIVALCAEAGTQSGARGRVLAHLVSPTGIDVAVAKGAAAAEAEKTRDAAPFFALLAQLLRDARESELAASRDAVGARRLAHLAMTRDVVEHTSSEVDFVLQGLLECISALLMRGGGVADAARAALLAPLPAAAADDDDDDDDDAVSSSFATRLFHRGLFAAPPPPPPGASWTEGDLAGALPLCKSRATRAVAFRALREMCGEIGAAGWAQVAARIVARHPLARGERESGGRSAEDDSQRFGATATEVAAHGYVGVRNLGCICYMNATNQQLFMVPSFRRALLGARTSSSAVSAADGSSEDGVLVAMQRLMGYLQESELQFYDPRPLCAALKDWDGNPVNVAVQQDASEYLQQVFQKLEAQLGTASDSALKSAFGGLTSSELVATSTRVAPETKLHSERIEPFYFMTVQVKDQGDLEAALRSYITGEAVDFTWDVAVPAAAEGAAAEGAAAEGAAAEASPSAGAEEGRGVEATTEKEELPTTKRNSIRQLPDHLIVHLKVIAPCTLSLSLNQLAPTNSLKSRSNELTRCPHLYSASSLITPRWSSLK